MAYLWSATFWYGDIAIEDHEAVAPARLIWQYRGDQPREQAFLSALITQVQSLEDVAYEVLTGVWPMTAVGVQLDNAGKIVGQLRYGMIDEEYRLMILGRIYVNKGDGQLPQFIELVGDILGFPPVQAFEFWPAALRIAASGVTYPDAVGDLLFDLKGGGIRLDYVSSVRDVGNVFRCSSQLAVDEASTTEGTANLAMTTGGYLGNLRWTK